MAINYVDSTSFLGKISLPGAPTTDTLHAILRLGSGFEIEGKPIACCLMLGNTAALPARPRVNNKMGWVDNAPFYIQGAIDPEFIKRFCSTGRSAHLCCKINQDGIIESVWLITRGVTWRHYAVGGQAVVLIEPPNCVWILKDGNVSQQIIQLRKSREWVARTIAAVIQDPVVAGIAPGNRIQRLLIETLYLASQQIQGMAIAIVPGDFDAHAKTIGNLAISSSITVNVDVTDPIQLLRFAEMDGCTLVKTAAHGFTVVSTGVYLETHGGRHASAEALSRQLDGIVVAVVSQDGPVTWYKGGVGHLIEDEDRFRPW
ncbi:MAG: DNA integrity scanning protein DisA nucleotide-binding domain protein [Magnetococcales bacterium]|nr:DNA integrity scanning protein DisA nucleotide-binding domain protein [Magnetococcales bacterium]